MRKTIYRSEERGFSNHGWLKTYHTFSFANYYDENRMRFGNLRVLNDHFVDPDTGFGRHPHDNIEIIAIPLTGTLAHTDERGNEQKAAKGEVQAVTAGTGISFRDFNPSTDQTLNFLQLWILPDRLDVEPLFQQKQFDFPPDELVSLIRPDGRRGCLAIRQEAYLHLGHFSEGRDLQYEAADPENGVFVFLIDGRVDVGGVTLHARDAIGLERTLEVGIHFVQDTELLIVEIPLERSF